MNRIRKTAAASVLDVLRYCGGGNPTDEWEFQIGSKVCKLKNGWRTGIELFVDGVSVAHNKDMISVRGKKPFLTADVLDDDGKTRHIDVFVRAILDTRIQIHIDGSPIQERFV